MVRKASSFCSIQPLIAEPILGLCVEPRFLAGGNADSIDGKIVSLSMLNDTGTMQIDRLPRRTSTEMFAPGGKSWRSSGTVERLNLSIGSNGSTPGSVTTLRDIFVILCCAILAQPSSIFGSTQRCRSPVVNSISPLLASHLVNRPG